MPRIRARGPSPPLVVLLCCLAALIGAGVAPGIQLLHGSHAPVAESAVPTRSTAPIPMPSPSSSPSTGGPANVADLEDSIRAYYADPGGTGRVGPTSPYAAATRGVAVAAAAYLETRTRRRGDVLVLDVDDTMLTTWAYTVAVDWHFVPGGPARWVRQQRFPAVPGVVELARRAKRAGYVLVYLTGRPESQRSSTLGNLTADGVGVDAGYPEPTLLRDGTSSLVLRPSGSDTPAYLAAACAAETGAVCTSGGYKAAVRAHLSALGYHVVADIGDQPSDLAGGWTGRVFPVPNPNYRVD